MRGREPQWKMRMCGACAVTVAARRGHKFQERILTHSHGRMHCRPAQCLHEVNLSPPGPEEPTPRRAHSA
eukprot:scaffold13002_cov125-Isochrysis_galbana.AAC.9